MNVYWISIPGKQELSFSGLTQPAQSLGIILSLRNGGVLGRHLHWSPHLPFHGPFLLPQECPGIPASLRRQRSRPMDRYQQMFCLEISEKTQWTVKLTKKNRPKESGASHFPLQRLQDIYNGLKMGLTEGSRSHPSRFPLPRPCQSWEESILDILFAIHRVFFLHYLK